MDGHDEGWAERDASPREVVLTWDEHLRVPVLVGGAGVTGAAFLIAPLWLAVLALLALLAAYDFDRNRPAR